MGEATDHANERRTFLRRLLGCGLLGVGASLGTGAIPEREPVNGAEERSGQAAPHGVTLFLCGDVMTGRGIDQALPHPSDPRLQEPYVRDARRYIALAERVSGPLETPVDFAYVWGDALSELRRMAPTLRLINLETAVTASDRYWRGKQIHYRMHPRNLPCVTSAGIHCCTLANNHVLDWGHAGLTETLQSLSGAGVATVGAGKDFEQARAVARLPLPGQQGRALVLGLGHGSSGIPSAWKATSYRGGVWRVEDLSAATVEQVARHLEQHRCHGDLVIVSIHWGPNWGYGIPAEQRDFAHRLIDLAGVDLVHGHSSHHVKGIEVYRERLILYGCGDFLNDYEGIGGYEEFRGDLSLMYFPVLEPGTGRLTGMRMTPTRVRRLRVERAGQGDTEWLQAVLNREGKGFGTWVEAGEGGALSLRWRS
jgi:poly-gamma-glutamate synthesis protein (capsule biosynthesis protein)